jgi:hypothetical protein
MAYARFRMIEPMTIRHPDQLEPRLLGAAPGLLSTHMSVVLDQFETQALDARDAHPHDGRRRLIEMIPTGGSGMRAWSRYRARSQIASPRRDGGMAGAPSRRCNTCAHPHRGRSHRSARRCTTRTTHRMTRWSVRLVGPGRDRMIAGRRVAR